MPYLSGKKNPVCEGPLAVQMQVVQDSAEERDPGGGYLGVPYITRYALFECLRHFNFLMVKIRA